MDGLKVFLWIGAVGCLSLDGKRVEPTRPANPRGEESAWSSGKHSEQGDVLVRLSIGKLLGQKVTVYNVPWTPNRDPVEQIRHDWIHFEPNPVAIINNITIMTFLGIPYAEPPISQRRFKLPQLLTELPGEQPYTAFQYPPSCAQNVEARPTLFINDPYPFRVSEDCLYLNIFTPSISLGGMPVIVFFHGGNFQTGSSSEWPGQVLSSRGIVVVTVNYRLGAFGFLSFGDKNTGNYGLEDQRIALQFVQHHIASFGGDPRQVTIVGHDAGAVSVDLFRAAVAMSGAEVSYHSTIGKPALAFNNTIKLGRYLGCTQPVAKHVWDCILTRSTNDIIQAVQTIPVGTVEYNRYLFLPHIDGRFIPAHPLLLLNSVSAGTIDYPSAVPYLTGFNKDDGSEGSGRVGLFVVWLTTEHSDGTIFRILLENRLLGEFNDFVSVDQEYLKNYILEYAFRHNYTTNREAVVEAIIDHYTYWPDTSDENARKREFINMLTDAYYVAPISLSAHLHSAAGSQVFMYANNYEFGRGSGVCHDCDLYLLFGFPYMPKNLLPKYFESITWTDADRNASQLLTFVFRQFAMYKNPNIPTDSTWLPFEPRRHWYLNFNYSLYFDFTKLGVLERDYRWKSVSFWNIYIPSLVQYMTTTTSPLEVKIRKELVAYQIALSITICILFGVLVLMCLFAYQLFEGNPKQTAKELDRRSLGPNTMAPKQISKKGGIGVDKGEKGTNKTKVTKALDAKKKVVKGHFKVHKKGVRTSVHFHRPRTLTLPRSPRYPRKSVPRREKLDAYAIIKHPLTTESAMKKIEDTNTLVFIVDIKSNKPQIRLAVKKLYNIDVQKVNTLVTPNHEKKAYVRLAPDYDALDVANKIGII
uniref:Ribosomal protein L23/L25 N-terminal domain-containing protein n=1 Tax=Setaria digitata TaxID=48799 RepID=A0A915PEC8_9BILA